MTRLDEKQLQSWGIALLRVMVGAVLLAHGSQKLLVYGIDGTAGAFAKMGLPLPMLSAVLSVGAEFLGGLALVLGVFTRWAAAVLTINMAVAAFAVHLKNGFFLPAGAEYALTLLVANLALVLTGAGAFAVDRRADFSPRGTLVPSPRLGTTAAGGGLKSAAG
jgi:putative oxidoreductase